MSEFEIKALALLEEIAANTKPPKSMMERIQELHEQDAKRAQFTEQTVGRVLSYLDDGELHKLAG